ncbi:MAG: superinfection immunity protein [bacterium]|nr:superinfection immunity protein [bacterium]
MTREYFIQQLSQMPPMALGLLLLYLLPTWFAIANRPKDALAIFGLNVLVGWSVIGYAVLIVRATKRKEV